MANSCSVHSFLTHRMYEGPPLPIDKISVVTPQSIYMELEPGAWSGLGGVKIVRIDGKRFEVSDSFFVELLPGKHTFEVVLDIRLRGPRGGPDWLVERTVSHAVPLEFNCEAGHVYLIDYKKGYFGLKEYKPGYYIGDPTLKWEPFIKDITYHQEIQIYMKNRQYGKINSLKGKRNVFLVE